MGVRGADDLVPRRGRVHRRSRPAGGRVRIGSSRDGVQHTVLRMPNDARFEDFTMMSNVFVSCEGRWVLVLAHAVNLPM